MKAVRRSVSNAMKWFSTVLFGLMVVMTGCSQQQSLTKVTLRHPPREITLTEQLTLLNIRAQALATLRAQGSIRLDYRGRLGNKHEYQAHGTLLVDQAPALDDATHQVAPDMLLLGTYLGQDAFELGTNPMHYWMVNHQDKQAWVGRESLRNRLTAGSIPISPNRLLDLLALTGLYQDKSQRIALTTSVVSSINRIYVIGIGRAGETWIKRIIFFNRRTDNVMAVILFNKHGKRIASARLSDYRAIAAKDDIPTKASPKIPFHVEIWYPAVHARLNLNIDSASLTLRVKPRFAFVLPHFDGLKVFDLDQQVAKPNR